MRAHPPEAEPAAICCVFEVPSTPIKRLSIGYQGLGSLERGLKGLYKDYVGYHRVSGLRVPRAPIIFGDLDP